jgi:hypothetical protein
VIGRIFFYRLSRHTRPVHRPTENPVPVLLFSFGFLLVVVQRRAPAIDRDTARVDERRFI